ncbi:hypothetical protein [Gracilimonas sp. BCB1]|uniref:hypothetical protein n=1 Tax=Gracilimonas sp. BCB1 TaxID=3152362 RepID=UPI0032D983E7
MRISLTQISVFILFSLIVVICISCSDITSISNDQIKEYSVRIDGPGSKTLNVQHLPLFLVNDHIISEEVGLRLKLEYIKHIKVLKGKTALELYGKKGEYGVVKIYADQRILSDLKPVEDQE